MAIKQPPRMNSKLAESFAERYLRSYSLDPMRFSKKEMRAKRTPDFRVNCHGSLALYCEAKHIEEDRWLHDQFQYAASGEIIGGLRDSDPIFNRLSNRIHEAVQQFNAVNVDHELPNVLVFANSERQCGFGDLRSVLTGDFYSKSGARDHIYGQFSDGRIGEEKLLVDLILWWDAWKPEDMYVRTIWENSKHKATIESLLPRPNVRVVKL